jgi:hypothetical protein
MVFRKKTKNSAQAITFQMPADSDLTSRIEKIAAQTGLDTSSLLQKWVLQEESLIGLMRRARGRTAKQPKTRILPDAFPQDASDAQKQEEIIECNPARPNYRQMLVKRAKKLKKDGMTLVKIADIYNEENLPTVSGRGKWYSSSIVNLLNSNVI